VNLEIEGKVALVTGAGGGLGSAIARALAKEKVFVAAADIHEDSVNRTVEAVRAEGGRAIALPWDLRRLDAMPAQLERVRAEFGEVDILVNNSGGPPPTKASGVSPDMWQTQFHEMVLTLMHLTDLVLPGMRARGWGRVITSTSSGVVAPIPNLGISNALRSTLVGWSKTLSREVAADGVTVNVVLPGRIATDRIRQLDEARAKREGKSIDDVVRESVASIPVGRYGRIEEYGDTVAFLASCRASFITGSVVRVDGGMIQSI
jgi:3-oxoacyl-[acyl-carrier protein] reductase